MPPAAPDGLLSGEGRDRELSSDVVSLPPAPDTPDDQPELGQLTDTLREERDRVQTLCNTTHQRTLDILIIAASHNTQHNLL